MNAVSAIVLYVVIWWLVLFAVLPWGARPLDNPEPGHADSAPARPRIGLKFAITTIIAALLWGAAYAVIVSGLISFRTP